MDEAEPQVGDQVAVRAYCISCLCHVDARGVVEKGTDADELGVYSHVLVQLTTSCEHAESYGQWVHVEEHVVVLSAIDLLAELV